MLKHDCDIHPNQPPKALLCLPMYRYIWHKTNSAEEEEEEEEEDEEGVDPYRDRL